MSSTGCSLKLLCHLVYCYTVKYLIGTQRTLDPSVYGVYSTTYFIFGYNQLKLSVEIRSLKLIAAWFLMK